MKMRKPAPFKPKAQQLGALAPVPMAQARSGMGKAVSAAPKSVMPQKPVAAKKASAPKKMKRYV